MKKFISTYFIVFLSTVWSYGQVSQLNGGPKPVSADFNAFSKYTDAQVNLSSGQISTSIPLYTVQDGPLSVPVALSYQSSGCKVGELASSVGYSWTLSAGGMIGRQFRNRPDDEWRDIQTLPGNPHQPTGFYFNGNDYTDYDKKDILEDKRDTEPDMFFYNINGMSGRFFFDENKQAQFIPKANIKIDVEFINAGNEILFGGFVLTASDGTKYYFGKDPKRSDVQYDEVTWKDYNGDITKDYKTGWYVTRIVSADGHHEIVFDYKKADYRFYGMSGGLTIRSPNINKDVYEDDEEHQDYPNLKWISMATNGYVLDKITGSSGIVWCSHSPRIDFENPAVGGTPAEKIDAIHFTDGYTCTKYKLNYDYFQSNIRQGWSDGTNHDTYENKLKLESIQKFSCDNDLSEPPYEFTYYGPQSTSDPSKQFLPMSISKAQDHWGYYNGQDGQGTTHDNNLEKGFTQKGSYGIRPNGDTLYYGELRRHSVDSVMIYGMLQSIKYPTGGNQSFEYEGNRVKHAIHNVNYPAALFPTIKDCSDGACCVSGNSIVQDVTVTADQISTGSLSFNVERGTPIPGGTGCPSYLFYSQVNLNIIQNGVIVYNLNFDVSPNNGFTLPISFINVVPGTFTVEVSNNIHRLVLSGSYWVTQGSNLVGGMRISKVTTHDGISTTNDMVRVFSYIDEDDGRSTGKLYSRPRYVGEPGGHSQSYYFVFPQNPHHAMVGGNGFHMGYRWVIESIRNNNHPRGGGRVYHYFSTEASGVTGNDNYFPFAPTKNKLHSGFPKSQYAYNKQDNLVSKTVSERTTEDYHIFGNTNCSILMELEEDNSGLFGDGMFFTTQWYHPRTSIYRPAYSISHIDGVKVSEVHYTYSTDDMILQPVETTTTYNDGDVVRTKNYFTHNYTVDPVVKDWFDSLYVKEKVWKTEITTNPPLVPGSNIQLQLSGNKTHYTLQSTPVGFFPYPDETFVYENRMDTTNWFWLSGNWNKVSESYYLNGLLRTMSSRKSNWNSVLYTYTPKKLPESISYQSLTKSFVYYSNSSALKSTEGADGLTESYTYDKLGRPQSILENCSGIFTEIDYAFADGTSLYNTKKVTKTYTQVDSSDVHIFKDYTYSDGIGRVVQTVAQGRSPDGKDMISMHLKDQKGQPTINYEPYESPHSDGRFHPVPTTHPHTVTTYEESPLSRKLTSTAPDWHTSTMQYGSNIENEVKWLRPYASTPYYPAKSLIKTVAIDGNGIEQHTFKDDKGNMVLSRRVDPSGVQHQETYFLHDQKQQLRRVLPTGADFNDSKKIYRYDYDLRGNVIAKQIPGMRASILYKYDKSGRLVAMANPNQQANNEMYSYKYDTYNRQIESGLVHNTDINTISSYSSSPYPSIDEVLTKTTYGGINFGGSNSSDDPLWVIKSESKILGTNDWIVTEPQYSDNCGRGTGSKGNSIINLNPNTNNTTVSLDWMGNVVQESHAVHQGSNVMVTQQHYTYDHAGRQKRHWHRLLADGTNIGAEPELLSENTYDEKNQLISMLLGGKHNSPLQQVDYAYRENGLLTSINGSSQGNVALNNNDLFSMKLFYDMAVPNVQSTAQMNGNIAGVQWKAAGDAGIKSYGYTYDFKNQLTHADYTMTVNGSLTDDDRYTSSYTYDALGNMKTLTRLGDYKNNGASPYTMIDDVVYNYEIGGNKLLSVTDNASHPIAKTQGLKSGNTSNNIYDDNGNMTYDGVRKVHITYNHLDLPTEITLQDGRKIKWVYEAGGGLLRKTLHDATGAEVERRDYVGDFEFRNGKVESIYHAQGRIANTANLKLNISGVLKQDYTYDAGEILSNALLLPGIDVNYFARDSICLREGFEVPLGSTFFGSFKSLKFRYEYHLSDHLGNTRVVFSDVNRDGMIQPSTEVLQNTSYYPFGLKHGVSGGKRYEKYGYNGMEHIDDFGLDITHTTYRTLDPALGRWMQIDPKASKYAGITPFNSMGNNPISLSDPNGDDAGVTLLIAMGVSIIANGINNVNNNKGFLYNAHIAAAYTAGGAVVSFGIGEIADFLLRMTNLSCTAVTVSQTSLHGLSGGIFSYAQGGKFVAGALSGAISSGLSSGVDAKKLGAGGMIALGGLSGGIGSRLAGGSFWDGVKQGILTSGLNHAMHLLTTLEKWRYGVVSSTDGDVGHSVALREKTQELFEIQQPVDADGNPIHSRLTLLSIKNSGAAIGYRYDMSTSAGKKAFWARYGDSYAKITWYRSVWLTSGAYDFFMSYVGKSWRYNLFTNNCKHFIYKGFQAGGHKGSAGTFIPAGAHPYDAPTTINPNH